MRVKHENLLTANGLTSVDMGSNFTLAPVWLGHIDNYAVQLVFTGSPNGSFKLQASNDNGNTENDKNLVTNWTDILNSNQLITAAGNHMYSVRNAGYQWYRVVWTFTSGSGTLTSAKSYVKGI